MSMDTVHIDAMRLPDSERASLALRLLESLPPVLHDPDEGLAEAVRRDQELKANPEIGLSWPQIKASLRR